MIIHDINGKRLQLTSTRLVEIEGSEEPTQRWYAKLTDINDSSVGKLLSVRIYLHEDARLTDENISCGRYSGVNTQAWLADVKKDGKLMFFGGDGFYNRVGCRRFDEKTFNLILAAAQVAANRSRT